MIKQFFNDAKNDAELEGSQIDFKVLNSTLNDITDEVAKLNVDSDEKDLNKKSIRVSLLKKK
jgi:hypothetical protein